MWNPTTELELLLCAARVDQDGDRAARIRELLRRQPDWHRLTQMARRHGLVPLLYRSILAAWPTGLDLAALAELESLYQANARRSLLLTAELLRCLDLLASHGVDAVPLRGPALAQSVYGDASLRQYDDLDILVHRRNVLKGRDLLTAQGYSSALPLNRAEEVAFLRSQSEMKLLRDAGLHLFVELHWAITERYFSFPLDPEALWQRLVPTCLEGRRVPTLSPEDQLMIACAHGTKHAWRRLGWICDVSRLIVTYPELDWSWLLSQARALRSERMLLLGLALAGSLLGSPLPQRVESAVRCDPSVARLAGEVRQRLCHATEEPLGLVSTAQFHLRARERLEDKVRYCVLLAATPTPGDWAAVALPPALFPLYYLLRPFRLIAEYGLHRPGKAR